MMFSSLTMVVLALLMIRLSLTMMGSKLSMMGALLTMIGSSLTMMAFDDKLINKINIQINYCHRYILTTNIIYK
jgi:hypothetical protein